MSFSISWWVKSKIQIEYWLKINIRLSQNVKIEYLSWIRRLISSTWVESKDWYWNSTWWLIYLCSFFSTSKSVIIMNNANVYCNSWIEELIISHECQISYLSCWIDDLSLIMSDVIFVFLLVKLKSYRTHLQRIKNLSS